MQELEIVREKIQNKYRVVKTDEDLEWNRAIDLCTNIINAHIKHMNDGWIPVDRELPPNAKHEGAFCPKYQVMTKYGVTEGWYNPDAEGWYVLIWFMTERYLDSEIDFDKGDKPRLLRLPDEVNNVQHILTAWRPLPDPYRPNIQNKPEEHYPEWRTKLLGKFDKRV